MNVAGENWPPILRSTRSTASFAKRKRTQVYILAEHGEADATGLSAFSTREGLAAVMSQWAGKLIAPIETLIATAEAINGPVRIVDAEAGPVISVVHAA